MSHTPTQHARHGSIPTHVVLSEPTELDLSPSKARAHATTTHAWTQITTWLTQLLPAGTPLPPFERNPATLAYLQGLMHANRGANASRRNLFEAQSAQLDAYAAQDARTSDASDGSALLDALGDGIGSEGSAALASLAEACVALGHVPAVGSAAVEAELGPRMLAVTAAVFELEEQVAALEETHRAFGAQIMAARKAEGQVRQEEEEEEAPGGGPKGEDGETSIAALRQQTSQLAAQTKHLALKLGEYQDRISALERSDDGPGFGFEELKRKEREVAAYRDIVRRLEDRLKEYHGLPPDLEASRAELRRAQAELDMWRTKREELFGEMGGG